MNPKIEKSVNLKPLPFVDSKNTLGFGQYFSDHWFCTEMKSTKDPGSQVQQVGEWSAGKIMPYGTLALDPAASVFHYGQALFEGMKAFRRKDGSIWLFRPDYNWERMSKGAERLCMRAPPRSVFMNGLRHLLQVDERWVPPHPGQALYIRPTLIGSEGFLGVRPSQEMIFFIILSPVGSYYGEMGPGVKIWVEDQALRAAPGGLGATKAGANYAASLQAAHKAKEKGYSQVLWLDVHHESVEEVGTMNVFFVFKNEIVTPPLSDSILAGGVRDSVLHLLRSWKLPVKERRLTMKEIQERMQVGELLEAFGAGTAAVISPISEFHYKGQDLKLPQPANQPRQESSSELWGLSKQLLKHLQELQHGEVPDQFGWMKSLAELE